MAIDTSIKKGYNQTDLSVIPEGWETQSLEGIADPKASICYGIVQVGSFASNGIPVLAIKNLNTDYFTNVHRSSPAIEALYARSRVCPGDILISVKGTIGRIGIVPQHFVGNISRDLARLRLTERDVPEFWFQMLQSESAQRRLGLATVGTTRMELSIGILKQIRMLCPPKVEQCAIARVLNDMDALIISLDQLIAKKRDIKQATMQQLLTGKTRLLEFSGMWETKELGEVFNITAGGDFDFHRSSSIQNEVHCYPIYSNAVSNNGLYGFCSYHNHHAGSITVTARGTLGVANFRDYNFTAIGRVLVLQPSLTVDGRFFSELINNQIDFIVESTGVPQLTAPQISKYKLSVPPLPEQQAIAAILTDMDAEIAALEQRRDKTRALKQGMMQELLTGKTRLL